MNSTSLALAKHDKNAPLNVGVSPAKGGWQLSDRWAWAYGLPVSGIARAVAGCIAYHARADTGVSWPGMGTIAEETGFGRTAIIAAIKVLELGGHVTVRRFKVGKKNVSNRYQLPPMGNVSASHPSPPDDLGGSASDGSEQVRTEPVSTKAARQRCADCGNSWPSRFGDACYRCLKKPKPRGGLPLYTERPVRASAEMTAQQTADANSLAVENGWRQQGDGSWKLLRLQ